MNTFIFIFEMVGVIAFSISGVIEAIKSKMDLLGVVILGVITSTGGGIIRDLILGISPPKSFTNPVYIYVATATSLLSFFFVYYNKRVLGNNVNRIFESLLLVSDALGLSVFTILGMNIAFEISGDFRGVLYVFVGVISGVGGGMLRDILTQEVPYVLDRNIYASAALIGALAYYFLRDSIDHRISLVISMALIFTIRVLAAKKDWNLPKAQ